MMAYNDFIDAWNDRSIKYHAQFELIDGYGPPEKDWMKHMGDWCERMVLWAKPFYYTGEPKMEDRVFDAFEDWLKAHRPTSHVLQKVGA